MNLLERFMSALRRVWTRGKSDEVSPRDQLEEWEREEGVRDDSHPHELDELR